MSATATARVRSRLTTTRAPSRLPLFKVANFISNSLFADGAVWSLPAGDIVGILYPFADLADPQGIPGVEHHRHLVGELFGMGLPRRKGLGMGAVR